MNLFILKPLRLILVVVGLALAVASAHAANYFWNTTTTSDFATGSLWSDNFFLGGTTGTVPGSSDTALFNQLGITAASTTVNLSADRTVQGLVFNNTGTATIIQSPTSHNNLFVGSGGILANSVAAAVSLGDSGFANYLGYIGLNADQSWINNSAATFTLNSNVKVANASHTLTIGGSGSTTMTIGLMDNGSFLTSLVKTGSGTLTLTDGATGSGAKFTMTGGATVNAGKLLLNSTASSTSGFANDLSSSCSLTLGGGSLVATWANTVTSLSNQQTVNGTTLNPGASTIGANNSQGTASATKNAVINLGTITRNAGSTVNFSATGNATAADKIYVASSSWTAGVAGTIVTDSGVAYATAVGSTAANSSPSSASDNWAGTDAINNICNSAFAVTYTASTASTLTLNADINSATDTTLAADASPTSLRFSHASARTITATGFTLTTGGILMASTVGVNNSTITGGTLRSAATASGKDLVVINNDASASLVIASTIANAAAGGTGLTKSGSSALVLSGANTYTGPTYINAGWISIANDGTTPSTGYPLGYYPSSVTPGAIYLNGGGLMASASLALGANRGITLGGNGGIFYPASSMTLTVNGVITSATSTATANSYGALSIGNSSNPGTVVLGGNNTFIGGVNISGGELKLAASNPNGLNSTAGSENTVLMNQAGTASASALAGAGSVLTLNGNSVTIGDLKGSGTAAAFPAVVQNANASGATLTVGNSQNLSGSTFNGVIQDGTGVGTLALVKTGAGSLTLSPSIVRSAGVSGTSGSTTINISDTSFLQIGTAVTGTGVGANTTITAINPNTSITVSVVNSGAVSGNLTFSQKLNTYTGGTTVKNGALNAGSGVLPNSTALTLGDASLNTSGVLNVSGNNNTVSSIGTAGTGGLNNLIYLNGSTITLTDNGSGTQTYNGTIGGTGTSFTYSGSSTLNLGGRLSLTGATTIGAGSTIKLTDANVLGTSGNATTTFKNVSTAGTYTLQYAAGATLNANAAVDLSVNTTPVTTFAVSLDGYNQNFASLNLGQKNIMTVTSSSGTPTLTVLGTTLIGAVNSASVSATNAPSSGVSVILNAVTGVTTTGGSTRVNTLALDGTTSGNQINGIISDIGGTTTAQTAISKQNSSTWTLGNVIHTYTGPTAVNGGTLLVNGTLNAGSVVTVANAATLGGSGTINGTLSVSVGGTIQPSLSGSVNTLTFANSALPSYPTGSSYATLKIRGSGTSLDRVSFTAAAGHSVANLDLIIDCASLSGAVSGATIYSVLSGTITGPFHSVTLVNNTGGYSPTLHYNATTITMDLIAITSLAWKGNVSATWNTADLNWVDAATRLTAYAFVDTDPLTFDDSGSANPSITLNSTVAPGNLNFTNSTMNYTISGSGNINGTASLTKDFPGTLTLSTANGYSGGTTLTAGQLNINNSGDATHSAIGTGALTLAAACTIDNTSAGDVTLTPNNAQTWNGNFTFAGTRNLNLGNGAVTLGASLTITNVANTLTVGGVIGGGNKNLFKAGAGTLLLTGAGGNSTFSGTLFVGSGVSGANDGAIKLTSAAPVNGISAIYVNVGAAGSSTLQLDGSGGAISISKPFSGLSGRTTTAPHIQNVAGNNVLSGQISLQSGGTLYAIQSDAGTLTLGTSGQTAITGQSLASGTRTVNFLGNGAITVAGDIISGTGGATVAVTSSAGTLALSGVNTYSGLTTISAGTLLINSPGSLAGAVTNFSGATLGGSGTIGGNVGFSAGANALFTNGAMLTISGSLTLNNNNVLLNLSNNVPAGVYPLATYNPTGSSGSFNTIPTVNSGSFAANTIHYITTASGQVNLVVLNTYSVSYNANGLSGTTPTDGNAYTNGASVTVQPPSGLTIPTGYSFAGWNGAANGSGTTYSSTFTMPANSLTLYAQTVINTYTVTFNTNGGSAVASQSVNYNATATLPTAPTKVGYIFAGWFTDNTTFANAYSFATPVTTNITLYAKWNVAAVTLNLFSSNQTNGYHNSVFFTATNLPMDAASNVVFQANGVSFSTNNVLNGGTTSFTITNLPRGTTNIIIATFNGDSVYPSAFTNLIQTVTNHPPVASAASYTRNTAVNQIKIAITNLLSHATDVDSDSLTLASVSVTTNNATILISGGWVLYDNTNAVADQFTYTVNDGFGGTNSATVTINIDSTPLFGQSTVASTSGGTATLNFAGIPTYSYSVNRSTNLIDWVTIWTTNAPTSGTFQFIDTSAPTPSAYYQLQFNP